MKKELISVIVPIYNVEKYLDQCVESIVNQTYKNLEIILVDDGSTDCSGQKCNEWAEKDCRVKVIHKVNGGLSDARNVGLQEATGQLIGFVDGDDYIEKKMYEMLQQDLMEYTADIAICNVQYVDERANPLPCFFKNDKEDLRILERKTALYLLVEDATIQSFAWNKLYKRELFDGVEYPKGKVLEDRATTYRLFDKAKKVVDDERIGYYYVQRSGSIMNTYNNKAIRDELEAINERMEYLVKYSELEEILVLNKLYSILNIFRSFYGENRRDEALEEILKEEVYFYRKNYKIYQKSLRKMIRKIMRKRKSLRIQVEERIFYWNPKVFRYYSLLFFQVKRLRNFVRRSK